MMRIILPLIATLAVSSAVQAEPLLLNDDEMASVTAGQFSVNGNIISSTGTTIDAGNANFVFDASLSRGPWNIENGEDKPLAAAEVTTPIQH